MIRSFRCPSSRALFEDRPALRFRAIERVARRKLLYLHAAQSIADLRSPPGNRLEALKGGRRGQHSIRINDQWRICFVWRDADAYDVEIVDYHQEATVPRTKRTLAPIHPGEILYEDFMVPKEISINRLARDLHVPPNRVSEIVNGRRAITADTALRLARYFKTTAELWLNLQMEYDVRRARRELEAEITAKVRPYRAA